MAVDNRQLEILANSIRDLVKSLNSRNGAGSRDGGVRTGRGGNSNSKTAGGHKSTATVEALADSLDNLHKSMKSGGSSIADTFTKMVKNLHPLIKAFQELDDAVDELTRNHTENQRKAARAAQEFIKANKGNIDAIREQNKESDELLSILSDIVKDHKKAAKDHKKYLKDEEKIRGIMETHGIELGETLKDLIDDLRVNPNKDIDAETFKKLQDELEDLSGVVEASSSVFSKWISTTSNMIKRGQAEFEKSIKNAVTRMGGALVADIKKVDNFISSRMRYGFESNEFTTAAMMGLSADELNAMRGGLRDVIDSLNGLGSSSKSINETTLREWADANKTIGLIGVESAEFTKKLVRNAYDTGREFNSEMNKKLIHDTSMLSAAFGVPADEAAAMMSDYSSQLYNISRFNAANTADEKAAVQEEITKRMILNRHLGFSIDYMKQQEMLQHNQQYADSITKITQSITGDIAMKTVQSDLGWSDENLRLYSGISNGLLTNPTIDQRERYGKLSMAFEERDAGFRKSEGAAYMKGSAAYTTELMGNDIILRTLSPNAGFNRQALSEGAIEATARAGVRGVDKVDFDTYYTQMNADAQKQINSLSAIEDNILSIRQATGGLAKTPVGATIGAGIGVGGDVAMKYMEMRLGGKAIDALVGGGKGGKGAAGVSRLGKFAKGAGPGALVGLAAGYGFDKVADSVGRDTKGGAAASVGSSAATWAGAGASIGLVFPPAAIPGAIIGGLVGTAKGLYDNRETLFNSPKDPPANSIQNSTDKANNMIRDEKGNLVPIDSLSSEQLATIVNLLTEQLEMQKTEAVATNDRFERQAQIAQHQNSVSQHMSHLAESMSSQFVVG